MSTAAPTLSSPALAQMRAAFDAQRSCASALRELKRAAFERFVAQGFPSLRQEDWRYLNLSRFEARAFVTHAASNVAGAKMMLDKFASVGAQYQVVFIDGRYEPEVSRLPPAGVTITSFGAVMDSDPQSAADLLSSSLTQGDAFSALNLALVQDGVIVDVPAKSEFKQPLHLVFLMTTSAALMTHPRIFIRVGTHASATIIEHYLHTAVGESFTNAVTNVHLAPGAVLEHCRDQEESPEAVHIGRMQADVGKDAKLLSHHFALGGTISRLGLNVQLNASGAEATLNGLQFAHATQQFDSHLHVDHVAASTRSQQDYRGIADGRGRVVFNGKVFVHANAMKTDAQQSSRNLLLAATAEIDTKPELEIYADDVKCAHGATVGQLDQAALFYLRSRGLSHEEARAALTLAFADSVISRFSWAPLRSHLSGVVHRRFKTEVSA